MPLNPTRAAHSTESGTAKRTASAERRACRSAARCRGSAIEMQGARTGSSASSASTMAATAATSPLDPGGAVINDDFTGTCWTRVRQASRDRGAAPGERRRAPRAEAQPAGQARRHLQVELQRKDAPVPSLLSASVTAPGRPQPPPTTGTSERGPIVQQREEPASPHRPGCRTAWAVAGSTTRAGKGGRRSSTGRTDHWPITSVPPSIASAPWGIRPGGWTPRWRARDGSRLRVLEVQNDLRRVAVQFRQTRLPE
jgi:hypothetical protein